MGPGIATECNSMTLSTRTGKYLKVLLLFCQVSWQQKCASPLHVIQQAFADLWHREEEIRRALGLYRFMIICPTLNAVNYAPQFPQGLV